jgi:hypothetical protein
VLRHAFRCGEAVAPRPRLAPLQLLEDRRLPSATPFGQEFLAPALTEPPARPLVANLLPAATPAGPPRHELVVIDPTVSNYGQLVNDLRTVPEPGRQFDIAILDPHRDGVAQVSELLAHEHGLDAVHFVTHGAEGEVQLGDSRLTANDLAGYANALAGWRGALSASADLLFYGCDVARGQDGRALVQALHVLTGAGVAASTDLTGSALRGGNWDLEYHAGAVHTPVAFSAAVEQSWSGLLWLFPLGYETKVNTNSGTQQTLAESPQAVAADSAGNFVVTWTGPDADGAGVFARRFNSSGNPLGAHFQVNTTTAYDQTNPVVAMDGAGDFVIAWATATTPGGGWELNAQRYAASGAALGGEFRVNTTTTGDQINPSVAMDTGGDFVVAWQSQGQDGSGWGVYGQRYNAAGVQAGGEFQINTTTAGDQKLARVAMDATGDFVVTWESYGQGGDGATQSNIYGQRYDFLGNPRGGEFLVNSAYTAGTQNYSAVAMDATGNFVVAWQSDGGHDGDGWGIFAQRFDAAGNPQGSEFRVNTTTANDQQYPAVAMNRGGAFVITWTDSAADGSGAGVYAQHYNADGTPSGWQLPVNTTTANDQHYSAAVYSGHNAVLVWSGNGTGDPDGVFLQRYIDINHAPVLSGTNNLTAINENPAVNNGTLVSALIAGHASDADGNPLGIAVTAVNNTNGAWQYSTDGGNTWADLGAPSESSARLLAADASTYVRFVPASDYYGTVASGLTFRAWDQTSGSAGGTADVRLNGFIFAYSSGEATAAITVNEVDQPPTVTAPGAESLAKNTPLIFSSAGGNPIVVADADSGGNPEQVSLTATYGTLTLSGTTGLTFVTGTGSGDTTMTFTGTLADLDAALDGLRYDPAPGYGGAASVAVTINDLGNTGVGGPLSASGSVRLIVGTPGITVMPTSGLTTSESGGQASFTVVLDTMPTGNVSIGVSSPNTNEGTVGPSSLTFTPANWNVPQTVTVTGVGDSVYDPSTPYTILLAPASSSDTNYDGLQGSSVQVTNLETDVAAITVTPTSGLVTTEAGGTATFSLALTSKPTADVTIPLSSSNPSQASVSAASLTFTAANWDQPQTVTITGVDDHIDDGDQNYTIITGPAVSTDANYSGMKPADVKGFNRNTDTAGITVTPTSGLVTTEAGGTATFTVALNSQPLADVTIPLRTSNPAQGVPSVTALTFTAGNWSLPQTVTVTGVDDRIDNGDQAYRIVAAPAVSADPHYGGLQASDVSLTNRNNDVAGIQILPTGPPAVGSARFRVVLTSQPTTSVTIPLTAGPGGEYQLSATALTFTPADWSTPQTVTVTPVIASASGESRTYTLNLTGVSGDTHYNGLAAPAVFVLSASRGPTPAAPAHAPITAAPAPSVPAAPSPVFVAAAPGQPQTTANDLVMLVTSNINLAQLGLPPRLDAGVRDTGATAAPGLSATLPPSAAVPRASAPSTAAATLALADVPLPSDVIFNDPDAAAAPRIQPVLLMRRFLQAGTSPPQAQIPPAAVPLRAAAPEVEAPPLPTQTDQAVAAPAVAVTRGGVLAAPLRRELDRLADRLEQDSWSPVEEVTFAAAVSVSVGYVALNVRSLYLLGTVLLSTPFWRQFDPAAVLDSWEACGREPEPFDADDEEQLHAILD